jgi:hypothetical protein
MARTKTRKSSSKTQASLGKIGFWLVVAFLTRLSLAYWQYSGDVRNHLAWGESVIRFGSEFFRVEFPGFNLPNYPSVTLYLFGLSAWLYDFYLDVTIWLNQTIGLFPSNLVFLAQSENMEIAFMKLAPIIADLGVGWLIYLLLNKSKFGLLAALLYLFNPAIIYVSTVWGQIESLPIFFLLLSALGTRKKSLWLANLAFVLAILSKQTALWLAPFYLLWSYQRFGASKTIQGILLQLGIFVISFLPLGLGPVASISWYIETLSGSSQVATDAAWNIWYFVVGNQTSDSQLLGPLSIRLWSLLALSLSFGYLLYRQWLGRSQNIYQYLFWASSLAFFIQTRVHERHLFPALVFLLLLPLPARTRVLAYAGISSYFLANLLWSLRLPFI